MLNEKRDWAKSEPPARNIPANITAINLDFISQWPFYAFDVQPSNQKRNELKSMTYAVRTVWRVWPSFTTLVVLSQPRVDTPR